MFVDACAIVSIFVSEPDAGSYETALAEARSPFSSTLAAWEAILVLARPEKLNITHERCEAIVCEWLSERGIELREAAASPRDILQLAVFAAMQQGAGKRRLSSFDCFQHAYAKAAGATLLTNDRLLRATGIATAP